MVLLRALGALLLCLFIGGAAASNEWNDTIVGYVGSRGDGAVLVYKAPCQEPVVSKVLPKYRDKFQSAKYVGSSTTLRGCWMPLDSGVVVLIWEDGTYGWMYQREFAYLHET